MTETSLAYYKWTENELNVNVFVSDFVLSLNKTVFSSGLGELLECKQEGKNKGSSNKVRTPTMSSQ